MPYRWLAPRKWDFSRTSKNCSSARFRASPLLNLAVALAPAIRARAGLAKTLIQSRRAAAPITTSLQSHTRLKIITRSSTSVNPMSPRLRVAPCPRSSTRHRSAARPRAPRARCLEGVREPNQKSDFMLRGAQLPNESTANQILTIRESACLIFWSPISRSFRAAK